MDEESDVFFMKMSHCFLTFLIYDNQINDRYQWSTIQQLRF